MQCLCNILKNEIHLKLSYGMQINIKVTCNLISKLWTPKFSTRWYYHYWRPWSSILKVFISQSRVEFIFCMEINIKISTSCIALDGSGKEICLQYLKKKVLHLILCSIVMQNIQIFYGGPLKFVVICSVWIWEMKA